MPILLAATTVLRASLTSAGHLGGRYEWSRLYEVTRTRRANEEFLPKSGIRAAARELGIDKVKHSEPSE
jgi:hypothetical protein